ncbi:alpha/beta-hydrolase [Sodiomyces alkalinus F11]|uniref:Alpha/beta-hydrolase n=1 Tax=Sodiomyces alkalinus (strain CBS 110278 / VKM F-3762 / F11) TaxID=1314773 RepID=A0A3N2QAM7_SODAK|nr:alpha/beta-hydrolase [Sodiomyces alkalinus F11]ROT43715.1 alpha/beta-hydrolase [Sodiomyces alkalinus F11]
MKLRAWPMALMVHLLHVTVFAKVCSASSTRPRVSVRQTSGLCETTPNVKSYSGYVALPPTTNFPYEQNLFFWFFESRQDPRNDPLVLWINGGPGSPSIGQALGSNGPCRVLDDSKTTKLNEWSWNNRANLLYIDQPVQTGFSYDTVVNGRMDLLTGNIFPDGADVPPEGSILFDGTFSSQDPRQTVNTTQNAARVIGGHWAPAIASHFNTQSDSLASSNPVSPTERLCPRPRPRPIRVATLGLIAPFIDVLVQNSALTYAYNNTYEIEIFDQDTVANITATFNAEGGCRNLTEACRATVAAQDPDGWGNAPAAWEICAFAFQTCYALTELPYSAQGRDPFDITQSAAERFPPPYALGFLNRENVQNFFITGDFLVSFAPTIESLLNVDIPVTLIYGDRDWRSNWFGGEDLSLALAHRGAAAFAAAGDDDGPVRRRGYTRQHGRFSFTVLRQAGHEAPYYQPDAAYAVFQRDLDGVDIATGRTPVAPGSSGYSTSGPSDIRGVKASRPSGPRPLFCYVAGRSLPAGSCSEEQIAALRDGSAVVEDFVVVNPPWRSPWRRGRERA